MVGLQHVAITVRYEPGVTYGTSLPWIAPELSDAGLDLIDDHLDGPIPSRTWAGRVDERTFERFAKSWGLPRQAERDGASKLADGKNSPAYVRTYDGMNWEVGGRSPVISVSVEVEPGSRPAESDHTCTSEPRRHDGPRALVRRARERSVGVR